jgi:hypothetical protein
MVRREPVFPVLPDGPITLRLRVAHARPEVAYLFVDMPVSNKTATKIKRLLARDEKLQSRKAR